MLSRAANRDRGSPASGFTLLEMVVTMGIFAILVALAVPTMRTWISNTKVRAVADGLQNGVRLAQTESLRRSRQVVFVLTNSTTPQALPLNALATGSYWAIYAIPSMTDGSEGTGAFIDSGVLGSTAANVTVNGKPAICFNSVGRLVGNPFPAVTTITGGATCTLPVTTVLPTNMPAELYNVALNGADHPLQVQVTLGGQVHLCDRSKTLSPGNPDGC